MIELRAWFYLSAARTVQLGITYFDAAGDDMGMAYMNAPIDTPSVWFQSSLVEVVPEGAFRAPRCDS